MSPTEKKKIAEILSVITDARIDLAHAVSDCDEDVVDSVADVIDRLYEQTGKLEAMIL